jgi:uncharacterized Fe-S center protein
MQSKVFALRKSKSDLVKEIHRLYDAVAKEIVQSGESVAVKLHFGEPGNTAYLKPQYVKPIVDLIKKQGALPFLTDANTLYKGGRSDSKTHLESAHKHGYSKETMGADVIIADGPDCHDVEKIIVNLKHFEDVSIARAAVTSDALIALTHFKGHDCAGFGGAIKNVGMGLGSKAGKQRMHADIVPKVDINKCEGDGDCVKWCPTNAITLVNEKAVIDLSKCIGCAECVAVCPTGAIAISWTGTPDSVQEKIAEYAYGILAGKKGKAAYFNFLMDISPNCDCYSKAGPPIVPDIGVLASNDIIAIDQACVDLVNNSEGRIKGGDKFKALYPTVDWSVQLKYGEEIGLGQRKYELIYLD